ncbi:MAG: hypothetical protein IKF10_03105 [Lachnospiraceae bacterium]|nr:hypothetical protein [Lachnospiraceae bacterium]
MNEKRSILSADVNLLEGPILKNLIIFALPILISYIFQQLYNTMDVAIVGNTLGTDSLAAMGSVTAVPYFPEIFRLNHLAEQISTSYS